MEEILDTKSQRQKQMLHLQSIDIYKFHHVVKNLQY
jgi:hypothetical protein